MDCKICGAKGISSSYGGPDVCGACDCYGFCKRCALLAGQIRQFKKKWLDFMNNQKDIPQKYVKIINDNFWELI